MNNSKVDHLFKSKLQNHPMKPPADAWISIQEQLGKRSNSLVHFYKVAAGLVLLCLSAYIGYSILNSTKENSFTDSSLSASEEQRTNSNQALADTPLTKEVDNSSLETETKSAVPNKPKYLNLELLNPVNNSSAALVRASGEFTIKRVDYSQPPAEIPGGEEQESLPPVTISYKSGNKLLNEDATSEPEKESTLRKAWDYALSVKNGEERPFNIKEMKNELFASNFKKKKPKTQD